MDPPRFRSAETWWPTSRAGEKHQPVFNRISGVAFRFSSETKPSAISPPPQDGHLCLSAEHQGGRTRHQPDGRRHGERRQKQLGQRADGARWRRCPSVSGHLLRQRLEPHGGPAGHGPGPQAGSDQTGDRLPPHLPGHHRGAHPAEGQGEERGLAHAQPHTLPRKWELVKERRDAFCSRPTRSSGW